MWWGPQDPGGLGWVGRGYPTLTPSQLLPEHDALCDPQVRGLEQPRPKASTGSKGEDFPLIPPSPTILGHPSSAWSDSQDLEIDFTDKNFISSAHMPVALSAQWRDCVSITQTSLQSSQDWKVRAPRQRPQKMKGPLTGPSLRADRDSLCGSARLLLVSQESPSSWGSRQPQLAAATTKLFCPYREAV